MSALDLTSFACSFEHPFFCHSGPSRLPSRNHGEGGRNLSVPLTSAKLSARPFFCHFDRSVAEWRNLWVLLSSVKPSGRDETDTAAHNRRIPRNTIRRTRVTVAGSLFFFLENTSPLKPARSRHRSEKRGDVRRQRASRNLRLSCRRPESRKVFLEDRRRKVTTMLPDHPRPKRRAAPSPADSWRGTRARIRAILSRHFEQATAAEEMYRLRD